MAAPLSSIIKNENNLKRTKSFGIQNQSGVSFAPNKKICLSPMLSRRNSATIAALYNDNSSSESSDEDEDNSQDESCYMNNQRRARKRAFSLKRSLSFADNKLNDAVSKYSDVDDDEGEEESKKHHSSRRSIPSTAGNSDVEKKSLKKEIESVVPELKKSHHRDSITSQSFSGDSKSQIRRSSIDCDQVARSRCFDYLVTAIDEAWARYCDATTYAEDEVYNNVDHLPNTPASLNFSDDNEDEDEEGDGDKNDDVYDEVDDGYKSASTNLTEYDSDFELKRRVSSQPSSVRLQQLKDRLLKAKYYLQDFIESDSFDEACAFWKRWDLIKYATIELVEDDDDDEVIESTIEDLEKGRFYGFS